MTDPATYYNSGQAVELSKYIITKRHDMRKYINNLQLQLLLFCIQRSTLRVYGEVAFDDEIEAQRFSPRIWRPFYRWCHNAAMDILDTYPSDYEPKHKELVDGIIETLVDVEWVWPVDLIGPRWSEIFQQLGHGTIITPQMILDIDWGV